MTEGPTESARWEVELRALHQELNELRTEQRELARAVAQLVQTFQALATHMGLVTEPYSKKPAEETARGDVPGFG